MINRTITPESTLLKKRIIPIILFHNYQIVKSRKFTDYRVFGNLEQTVEVFNQRNVDELVILDIGASKYGNGVNIDILKILSRNSTMPLCYGGGIRTLKDIQKCLLSGCDKVVINSELIRNPQLVYKSARMFGSQCIVASIDCFQNNDKQWSVHSHSGQNVDNLNPIEYAKKLISLGAGELLINSVDLDGVMEGYDLDLLESLVKELTVPILICGGCGKPEDMVNAFIMGVDGCCAGSIFYYTEFGYKDIKNYVINNNIPVRIV